MERPRLLIAGAAAAAVVVIVVVLLLAGGGSSQSSGPAASKTYGATIAGSHPKVAPNHVASGSVVRNYNHPSKPPVSGPQGYGPTGTTGPTSTASTSKPPAGATIVHSYTPAPAPATFQGRVAQSCTTGHGQYERAKATAAKRGDSELLAVDVSLGELIALQQDVSQVPASQSAAYQQAVGEAAQALSELRQLVGPNTPSNGPQVQRYAQMLSTARSELAKLGFSNCLP